MCVYIKQKQHNLLIFLFTGNSWNICWLRNEYRTCSWWNSVLSKFSLCYFFHSYINKDCIPILWQ